MNKYEVADYFHKRWIQLFSDWKLEDKAIVANYATVQLEVSIALSVRQEFPVCALLISYHS